MLRVGLTGGIACGKTHVLRQLAAAGLHTLDLDPIARELLAPGGAAFPDVLQAFGDGILDGSGSIDRRALGALVFADPLARARLNAVVHPRVRAEEARREEAFAANAGAVVVTDGALLVESGAHLRFDRLIVVHCGEAEQLRRLRERDGFAEAAARARIESQMPTELKRGFAHFQVDTSGSREDTDRAAVELAIALKQLAGRPRSIVTIPLDRVAGLFGHGPKKGPRGLTPAGVLHEIVEGQGLDMGRLARLLVPPAEGAWYQAADPDERGPGPEALVAPLVVFGLVRGADHDYLASAAATLARLTHRGPPDIAECCLFALALASVAAERGISPILGERLANLAGLATRWGGAPPAGRTAIAVRAAVAHPVDPDHAREACRRAGGIPELAGALVGLAAGAPVESLPQRLVADLEGLSAE